MIPKSRPARKGSNGRRATSILSPETRGLALYAYTFVSYVVCQAARFSRIYEIAGFRPIDRVRRAPYNGTLAGRYLIHEGVDDDQS